uniref:hypothetical protein n=1 Tax=Mariniflexile sp. TaxID=1979402 RepID=UPI0040470899
MFLAENELIPIDIGSSDETVFERHSIATNKKIDEIWANFSHFLGNTKRQDEFKVVNQQFTTFTVLKPTKKQCKTKEELS